MTRGSKFGVLLGGLALTAVALTLVFRAPLLETLLRSALVYRDVPNPRLTVESVTLRETAIANLSLGAADEVQVAKVTVAYDLPGLVAGQVQSLVLDGVRLKLDLRGGEPTLGSLQSIAAGNGAEPQAAPALPPVTLRDARIEALTPLGPVSGRIDGALRPDEAGALNATLQFGLQGDFGRLRGELRAMRTADGKTQASLEFTDGALALPGAELSGLRGGGSLSATGTLVETAKLDLTLSEVAVPGASFEQARFALGLAGARLEIDAEMATDDGQFTVRAKAALGDFPARPSGQIQFDAEIGAQAILWPLLALPAPSRGRANASLTVQGRLPSLANLIGAEAGPLSALKPDDFTGRAKLRLSEIDYPGLVQGLSGELGLAARPGPDFPDRLTAEMGLTFALARLTWGDIDARKIAISQKATLEVSDREIVLTSTDMGEINVGDFKYASIAAADGALTARIVKATTSVDLGEESGFGLLHDITLAPRKMGFTLARTGARRLKLQAQAKELRARGGYTAAGYAGEVRLSGGQVTVPVYDLAAEGLNATLRLAPAGDIDLAFKLGALRQTTEPPTMAPIGLHGEARQSGDSLTFSVKGSGPNGLGQATLSGRHSAVDGVGEAQITLAPLVFVPGAAQPQTLFPALSGLRNVDGTASGEAALSWTPEGVTGTAALHMGDFSFDSSAARVEGLSLDLALNQVQPPGSAPGQVFSVRRINPGTPIDDLSVRFQVMPADSPAIAIESASLRLAGGRFSFADVVVDPGSQQLHLPVGVDGLDLAEVFSLLNLEGLAGDGRLSGAIPLTITDGIPRIADGRLTAQEPGILRVKSDYAEKALASAGESAELLLQALEEFHYEELNLTIDQPSEDLAVIGLSMLGSNPDVLEGYPFRFNVNLETDPRKLLNTLQEAFSISKRAIGQMWMFGR